jgi:hypothetical protein
MTNLISNVIKQSKKNNDIQKIDFIKHYFKNTFLDK